MARPSPRYEPQRPRNLLYRIVQEPWETFRLDAGRLRDGEGLPGYGPFFQALCGKCDELDEG